MASGQGPKRIDHIILPQLHDSDHVAFMIVQDTGCGVLCGTMNHECLLSDDTQLPAGNTLKSRDHLSQGLSLICEL